MLGQCPQLGRGTAPFGTGGETAFTVGSEFIIDGGMSTL
jgi:hypothetical protein